MLENAPKKGRRWLRLLVICSVVGVGMSFLSFFLFAQFDTSRAVTLATLLSFVAFTIGCINIWAVRRENSENRRTLESKEISEIRRTISTRKIGPFPEQFGEIVEFAKGVNDKFIIMADSADYGATFKADLFHEFHLCLAALSANPRCSVRMLISGPQRIQQTTQWSAETDLALWKSKLRQSGYAARCGIDPDEFNTIDQLNNYFLRVHDVFVRELMHKGTIIRRLPRSRDELSFFLWMRDDNEAILLFTEPGHASRGLAFRTTDSVLVEILRQRFESDWNRSQIIDRMPSLNSAEDPADLAVRDYSE